ncbi:hypothetical protein [Amycolatopsis anabasis]|uniref:hypothetical protein n=1 Tax=Amycolatopsis anabasis TaxID=1840409 RepID=UPI00131E8D6E|nr:hypothetical protein [Amycolatopsis anabasis]
MPNDDSPAEPPEVAHPARRPLVLAAVAGFALGSAVFGLLWASSGSATGPAEDARAACAALARAAGELPGPRPDVELGLSPGLLRRIAAARELSAAAAEISGTYRELANHLDGVSRMVVSLNFADPAGRWHLTRATEMCGHV